MMKTLLVVDDEAGIAEALSETLSDEGYRVVTAANGRMGFDLLQQERPALVLLDYMMPVEDGLSMLRRMRAHPEFASIPVVMMSAVSEAAVRKDAVGLNAFLQKPFRLDAVLGTVARLLADS